MGSVGISACMGRSAWGAYKGGELKEGCRWHVLQLARVKVSAPRPELRTISGIHPWVIQGRADPPSLPMAPSICSSERHSWTERGALSPPSTPQSLSPPLGLGTQAPSLALASSLPTGTDQPTAPGFLCSAGLRQEACRGGLRRL